MGPRRDPFFFDLAQFFKIIPDRNYMNHPYPPPPTATSFRFPSRNEKIVLNGVNYGTAGSNNCVIAQPMDLFVAVRRHLDRDRDAQEAARAGRRIARRHWSMGHYRTPNGKSE